MHSQAFRKCSLPDLCKTDLFYAEHMLRHFNAIGRQGAVIQQLNQSLPPTLHGLYRMMLAECQRRTAANRQEAVAVLLRWILFSFRPLALDEVVSLIRHAGDDESFDLEEIPEAMSKFVQIGDPGEAFEAGQTSEIMYLITDDLPEPVYNDGQLPLMLRQRAMRSFFLDPSAAGSNLLTTPSEAHRRIFLAAVVFARPTPEGAVANVDLVCRSMPQCSWLTTGWGFVWRSIRPRRESKPWRPSHRSCPMSTASLAWWKLAKSSILKRSVARSLRECPLGRTGQRKRDCNSAPLLANGGCEFAKTHPAVCWNSPKLISSQCIERRALS